MLYSEHKGRLIFNNRLRLTLMTLSKRGKRKLLLKCLHVTQLLHLRLVPNHPKSIMKDLEGVFLERKMDSDNLYTTSKQHKSAFFFRESVVFFSVQRESNQTYFDKQNTFSSYSWSRFSYFFQCSSSLTSPLQQQPFRFQYFITQVL